MKSGARVAMAIGAGYVFGRTRKMRLAMMAAAASATGIIATAPREVLQRAVRRTLSAPEVNEIANSVRGDLAGAVRSAAVTAATSRIESLNARLRDVEPANGDVPEPEGAQPSAEADTDTESADTDTDTDAESAEADTDAESAEADTDTESAETDAEPPAEPKRAPTRSRSTSTARRTRASSTTNRAPVRRTRR